MSTTTGTTISVTADVNIQLYLWTSDSRGTSYPALFSRTYSPDRTTAVQTITKVPFSIIVTGYSDYYATNIYRVTGTFNITLNGVMYSVLIIVDPPYAGTHYDRQLYVTDPKGNRVQNIYSQFSLTNITSTDPTVTIPSNLASIPELSYGLALNDRIVPNIVSGTYDGRKYTGEGDGITGDISLIDGTCKHVVNFPTSMSDDHSGFDGVPEGKTATYRVLTDGTQQIITQILKPSINPDINAGFLYVNVPLSKSISFRLLTYSWYVSPSCPAVYETVNDKSCSSVVESGYKNVTCYSQMPLFTWGMSANY